MASQGIIDTGCIIYDVSRMSDSEDEENRDWDGFLIEDYPEDNLPFSLKAATFLAGIATIVGCMLVCYSIDPSSD